MVSNVPTEIALVNDHSHYPLLGIDRNRNLQGTQLGLRHKFLAGPVSCGMDRLIRHNSSYLRDGRHPVVLSSENYGESRRAECDV